MIGRALASLIRGYICYTPPHPGRGLLGKVARWLDPSVRKFEVAPGVWLRLDLRNPHHFYYWTGDFFEPEELSIFLSFLRPGMTVLDVGANIGIYTCSAARAVSPAGRVISFEPVPAVYQELIGNIKLNGLSNVTVVPAAASSQAGHAQFHTGQLDGLGSLVRASGTNQVLEVATVTIDEVLARESIQKVDAVKIDVEGAEPLVIRGMAGLLQSPVRPILLIEHNDDALAKAGFSSEQLFASVRQFGYRAFVIRRGALTEVDRPTRADAMGFVNYVYLPTDGGAGGTKA